MTEEQARGRLQRMVAADTEPVLSSEDLDELVAIAKRPDSSCRIPSDPEWVPTWDLDTAAATGWEWKAGKASAHINFGEDGQSFARQQVYDHCMAQAALYRRGRGAVRTSSFADSISVPPRVDLV